MAVLVRSQIDDGVAVVTIDDPPVDALGAAPMFHAGTIGPPTVLRRVQDYRAARRPREPAPLLARLAAKAADSTIPSSPPSPERSP